MAEGSFPGGRSALWVLVPALAWGGVILELAIPSSPLFLSLGSLGCVLGSAAIAALAFSRRKKDIVSLCTPIFAVIIFVFPMETKPTLVLEVLYAATLTALVIRLEKRFPE